MNCDFCYAPLNFEYTTYQSSTYKEVACQHPSCLEANVLYKFINYDILDMIQFKAILNERTYYINYYVTVHQMNVTKQSLTTYLYEGKPQHSYDSVLRLDYQSMILTPTNVNEKLSLFLLFT
jgi:hypothetical protein